MKFRHITQEEMRGKGNIGKPTTPGVSAAEMQRILDELPREVLAPAMNQLADQLEADTAAAGLGAQLPGETGELPTNTPHTIQAVLGALLGHIRGHIQNRENPHGVNAWQVGAYTKEETDQAISQRVVEMGSSDMTKAEYGGSAPGVVKKADDALRLGSRSPDFYSAAEEVRVFAAAFRLDGWQKSGSTWMQTAPCQGMKAAYHTGAPWFRKTGVQKTDEQLQAAFDLVVGGYLETLDGKIRATLYGDKPSCDVKLFFQRRTLGEDGGGGSAEALEFATSQEVQQMLDEELGKGGA